MDPTRSDTTRQPYQPESRGASKQYKIVQRQIGWISSRNLTHELDIPATILRALSATTSEAEELLWYCYN